MGVGGGADSGFGIALGAGIAPLLFSIKRRPLSMLRPMRELTKWYDLTPARLDMLRIIRLYWRHGLPQWKLVKLLDIAQPAVSRMLGILECTGYVEREESLSDGRSLIIRLTLFGRMVVDRFVSDCLVTENLTELCGSLFGLRALRDRQKFYRRVNVGRIRATDDAPFLHPWRVG